SPPPTPDVMTPAEPPRETSATEVSSPQDEPGRMVVADALLRDPLDGDYLDAVKRALDGPLPESEDSGLGVVAPGDLPPVSVVDTGGDGGGGGGNSSSDADMSVHAG